MDEEKARLGVMLADTELMGIPHRVVIGERGLESGYVEYQRRRDGEKQELPVSDLTKLLLERLLAS